MTSETWERQRRSFERTAEAYDRFRPTYPDEIFDDIKSYADLAPDDRILEIGAGTGRATVHFAHWGNPILAIEPAAAMADIARANLAAYPNVDVVTSAFEEAAVEPHAFGLVATAQAFHWLDRETRVDRIADALYAYGTAAVIANVQVTPDDYRDFWVRVQDVYLGIAPGLAHEGDFRKPDDLPAHTFDGSRLFVDLEQRSHPWQWTLDAQTYVGLLQTASPHASLPDDARRRLIDAIAELVESEFDGHVTEHYIALVDLARRSAA